MAGLLSDIRFAYRQLRKSPGFTLTALVLLALGICANSTVFSWINATMLHPIPGVRDTRGLVTVMRGDWNMSPAPPFSLPDFRDLRRTNRSFSGMLAYHHDWLTLTGGDVPERIFVTNTSANYFELLGVKPFLGRFFRPGEEAQPGGVPYAVLNYDLWQKHFGADPAIVGKSIEIARHRLTVIGVAPKGFIGCMTGIRSDAWLPLAANTDPGSNDWIERRGHFFLNVMGRLRPGVSRASGTQDLELLMRQLVAQYPADHPGVNTITLDPLWRAPFGANVYMSASLPILLAIAVAVLLLTGANIATLALVRFVSRRRELAIRQALGAGRATLVRQMMSEGLMVSLAAGALACLLTLWSARMLAAFIPPNASPIVLNGYVDSNVIAAIVLLTVVSSVLCGALPALRSSRVPAAEVLKEESAGLSSGAHNRRLLSALVVLQIALSLALLICSGLFLRTLRAALETDPGFERVHVLTASVDLATAGYSEKDILLFQHRLLDQLEVLPRVTTASIADWVPLSLTRKTADAYPEGYVPQLHEPIEIRRADVSPGYFETLSIPILEGRAFTRNDNENAPRVVIVDETAARRYWPGQNPLGRRLHVFGNWCTVIGVARNTKHSRMSEDLEPMVYFSLFQFTDIETILQVRTNGDAYALAPAAEHAVHEINSRLTVFDVRTLDDTAQIAFMFQRMPALFATILAILALVLAATGIYGLVAYRTELRTHEIGIRVALGASRPDVMRLVLGQGLRLTIAGLSLGLALAFVATRFLRNLLYGVSATDPFTAFCVTALLAAIAIAACYLPARRATRVNPVTALRVP